MFDCGKMRDRKFMQYVGIVLVVLAIAGALSLIRLAVQSQGTWVVVTLDGVQTAKYNLMENGTYQIEGNGTDYNQLVIQDGTASIVEANCQNQVCVHSKAISHTGETITCLPHKIQITIEGGETLEYDTFAN